MFFAATAISPAAVRLPGADSAAYALLGGVRS
jgi:hypothetical protein